MRYIITVFSLLMILLSGCQEEEELAVRSYPRLQTLPVSGNSNEGATFNADFLLRGEAEILAYGFVWDKKKLPTITESDRVIFQDQAEDSGFSTDIRSTLQEGEKYTVRAFVKTPEYLVYGQKVSFTSGGSNPPVITSVEPLVGTVGDTLMFKGRGFSYCVETNGVFVNNMLATAIWSTDRELKVIVPRNIKPENIIRVNIAGSAVLFDKSFRRSSPVIHSVSSSEVTVGDTIEVVGEGFSYLKNSNKVFIGNQACQVLDAAKKQLSVQIPTTLEAGVYVLHLTVEEEQTTYTSITVIK